jgi:hypothetical protein
MTSTDLSMQNFTIQLSVPEICVALTLDKKTFVKEKHYVDFVDKYTKEGGPEGLGMTGLACYRLRGGVVHRANFAGHHKVDWTNVVFTVPETAIQIHSLSMNAAGKTAAMLSLTMFCKAMISAALRWYEDHKDDPKVAEAMNDMIRWCPNGLPPFCGGSPVVASGP